MFTTRYIQKEYSDLIQNDLAPQFLGLWVKMHEEGVPADIAKRAMALALFRTSFHLKETSDLADDDEFLKMINDVREVIAKYDDLGIHYGKISSCLEYLITIVLGTKSLEDEK